DYSSFLNIIAKDRILIVDDQVLVRRLFVGCLSERYDCSEAASTKEALALLAETEFALVITDMIMPGLSGIELLRKIVEMYPYTGVIMVSGINQPQRVLDAVRLGAFDYLIKPCNLDVLELTVERALERRTLLTNARQYKIDLEMRNFELLQEKAKLERLQAQIIHSEKMASLGQLSAGIAHELNNPVGFIYGNMDVLSECVGGLTELLDYYDKTAPSDSVAAGAARIKERIDYAATLEDLDSIIKDCRDGAQRIRDIVQNLRTFSRLDEAEFKESDVHEGIDSTVRLLSRYYSSDNITLIRDYGDLPPVEAFSGQLNQVWMNLLVNAAQAISASSGEVRIGTRAEKESVVVAIADTGCGIAPENLNRIFEPFYTTKPVGEGTGLGLSISFGIVERHGGTIAVDTRLGEGTTFTVTLPLRISRGFI
ncbi:MAG TPA: ATP-binding protein, partial [Pyrinomonadaceae bacterium]